MLDPAGQSKVKIFSIFCETGNVRYELFLIPFIIPDNFTINGLVHIDVDISTATTNITVHVYDMEIHETEVGVLLEDGSSVEVTGHGYDQERQFYIISLGQELSQTSARLTISWTGNLNDELSGFYRETVPAST